MGQLHYLEVVVLKHVRLGHDTNEECGTVVRVPLDSCSTAPRRADIQRCWAFDRRQTARRPSTAEAG